MPRSFTVMMSALWVPGLISTATSPSRAVEGRRGAEDGIRHLHLEGGEQVVAVAAEHVVVLDLDLEVEVAVRAAGRAGLALRRASAGACPVSTPAGMSTGDGALGAHPALARQVGQGFGMTVP